MKTRHSRTFKQLTAEHPSNANRIAEAIHAQHSAYARGEIDGITVILHDGTEVLLHRATDVRYHQGESLYKKKSCKRRKPLVLLRRIIIAIVYLIKKQIKMRK